MASPLFSRASGLGPLFAILEAEQGVEAVRRLRHESGLAGATYAPSTLVPFAVMNRLYNCAAKLSGDPQFGARVGQIIDLEEFAPFVEYALQGESLGEVIARSIAAQPLHSNELLIDLRAVGGDARWRIRYRANVEPTVEHHAQRSLMQMLAAVRRAPGAQDGEIEIDVAEPYAFEARLLEDRIGVRVRPRANDYELIFPARWLDERMPPAGLPSEIAPAFAQYPGQPLPVTIAEAALAALDLRDKSAGLDAIAADLNLPTRTLQYALGRKA